MDQMTKTQCGDHGNSDSTSETFAYHDEDSVDIYAGLQDSPEKNTNTEKACRSFLSPRHSESMDLFEEIIVEEHLKKEASYNEMKTKFEESRCQLQELIQKLQQLETQNVSLQTENTLLKKNICALIKTARSEIGRKDAEINRLSERTGRGSCGPIHHRPQSNQHMSQAATSGSSKGDDRPASLCKPHHEKPNRNEKAFAKNPPFTPGQTSSSLSSTQLSKTQDVSVPCNRTDKPVNNHNSTSDPLESGNQHLLVHGSSDRKTTPSLTADSRGQNDKEIKKDSQMVPSSTKSDQNHSAHSSRPSKTQHNNSTDMLASGKSKDHKGTKPQRHKSPPQHHGTSEKSKQSSKDFSENISYLEKSRGCREEEAFNETQRSWHSIRSESSRVSSRQRREKSPTRDYHRTEERWKECASRESRSTRSDKSRDHEHKSRKHEKERSRRNRESNSKRERQETEEKVPVRRHDDAEGRAVTSSGRPDNSPYSSSYKREPRRSSEDIRREPTEKLQETRDKKTNDSASSESHASKNTPPVGQEIESNFLPSSKESVLEDSGTKKTTKKVKLTTPNHIETNLSSFEYTNDNERQRKSDQDACQAKNAVVSQEVARDEGASEDSSPNRKLSFMETLNLTLSPQKKPNQLSECKTLDRESVKDGECSPSSLERTDPIDPTGEEFYVIDELEASVEESHVNEKVPVSLNSSEKAHECSSKTSALEVENPVPDDIEMPVKPSSEADSLKAIDVKHNVECNLPTPAADEKAVVTTETSTPHLISHEENHSVSNSTYSSTESVAVMEIDIVTSVSPAEEAVIESTLNTEKANTTTAEPTTLDFPGSSAENGEEKTSDTMTASSLCSGMLQDEALSIMASKMYTDKEATPVKGNICMDSVSSTVNLETSPSCPSSCAVRLDVPEVSKMETERAENIASHGLLEEQINEVLDVSSTSKKDSVLQEKVVASSSETPAKQAKDCEPDSTENTEHNTEPSSSIVLPQDEDSMMLTLKTIRLIPEAISPLTSPVRLVKKVQLPPTEKHPHVKSLSKDFQNVLAGTTSSKVVDVNKENKKPDCSTPAKEDSAPATLAKPDQDGLEEGEIVSDCESDEAAATAKSPKISNESKKFTTMKTQSPRTRLARVASQKQSVDLQPKFVRKTPTTVVNRSPTNKRRFKTVPPPDPKTLPPSSTSVEEIMNMFKVIRSQLRKKYMKLHKSFPMKTFNSVIEMSNLSFTDLVSSLKLAKLCGEESDIKAKLKKIIINVMNKVANNGIVNRIFEQNSDNLKSKLWSFVDGQLDFLFKEIQMTLLSASKPLDGKQAPQKGLSDNPASKDKVKKPHEKSPSRSSTTTKKQQEEASLLKAKEPPLISSPCPIRRPAYQTGLGSRGKNLRMNAEECNEDPCASGSTQEIACHTSEGLPADKSVDRVSTFVRRLSHSGSILDKSEFEILTEQQTSSLTFNLVSDSQMGDIFKSLLQGSDLLENSVSMADNQSWLLGTPKKEMSSERNFLTSMMSPTKFGTPSKLMSAWASISPCKFLSPTPKAQMPLNPAALDESCLLEIPSSPVSSRALQPTPVSLQKTYSILAEDLAVSLTIPSPMKTDSHLSFLNPVNEEPISTPEDVRNAHISEDAVLDGEDATEHDIHLSLDTDNSSGESSAAQTWDSTDPKVFQFKPHVPMQAVVTERSNDHFIVKIRHTSTVGAIVPTPLAAESVIPYLAEAPATLTSETVKEPVSYTGQDHRMSEDSPVEKSLLVDPASEIATSSTKEDLCSSPDTQLNVNVSPVSVVPTEAQQNQAEASESTSKDEEVRGSQESGNNGQLNRKRKKHHTEPKAKRSKSEMIPDRHHKRKHKKKTKSSAEREVKASLKKKSKSTVSSPQLSPQSLSAKNVIRKRGEVVVTWTRDEDRDILIELKTKGPSRGTFSALSEKMNKSPSQIAERFSQLMKLFKKKEKLDC